MPPQTEQGTAEPAQGNGGLGPAEFMEPGPPIFANEVSMLVDCFKVWINDLWH